jgi:hypothetical protein
MSKKHFVALAQALKFERPAATGNETHDRAARQSWRACVKAVADVSQRANVAFDRDRFYTACGFTEAGS